MSIDSSQSLKANIQQHIDYATQEECGKNIDTLIQEVSKTNFDTLAEEHNKEKKDRTNDANIRYWFTITTLSISAFAVVCAIASIVMTAGLITGGVQTVAIVTGFVGVTTAFTLFDKAVYRYLNYDIELKKKKTKIGKLEKKFDEIKTLIQERIKTLATIEAKEIKTKRTEEILNQIKRVNTLIERVKVEIPQKIIHFHYIDASPLMKLA